jgi:hypothetical protein
MKKTLVLFALIVLSQVSKAQQGFGTNNPDPSTVIDMVGSTKGVLMPRVALSSLIVAAPVVSPADALTVFNTATSGSGANAVTPGYYYWSVPQMKWVRLLDASKNINNWNIEETTTQATLNTQNIYQNGNVGIGDFSGSKPLTRLDVRGGMRGGVPHPDELSGTSPIGLNSVAIGDQNIASQEISTVIGGGYNQATGYNSTIIGGDNNVASNHTAVVLASSGSTASNAQALVIGGNQNEASGRQSIVIGGSNNIASGSNSTIIGLNNTAPSFGEIVVGMYGTDYTPLNKTSPNYADRLFNVGAGAGAALLADAFTILKNGRTGIGFNNFEAVSFTEKLQVNGNARLSGLPSITGSLSTDKIVVADANGVLKTVAASAFTADVRRIGTNHISEDAGTGSTGTAIPGNFNIAIGPGAMSAAAGATVQGNVAIGGGNQLANTTTQGSVAIGYGNLPKATSSTNLAVGALNFSEVTTGSANLAFGNSNITKLTTGSDNYAYGFGVLNEITTQVQNLGFGSQVLNKAVGDRNIAVGHTILTALTTGSDNVGFGTAAGNSLTTGNHNTFFGTEAANRISGPAGEKYTSGSYSLFLGSQTKANSTVSNQLNIGNWIYGESGNLALGNFTGATALPTITSTNRLDVVTGNVRVRDITAAYTPVATDKVVIADNLGVLRTTTQSNLVSANNGLTKNVTTNEIELGGTLNRITNINMGGTASIPYQKLSFTTKNSETFFSEFGGLYHQGLNTSDYSSAFINVSSPDKVAPTGANGRTEIDIQAFEASAAQIFASGDTRQFSFGTNRTTNAAPITFFTSNGSGAAGSEKMRLTPTGEILINASVTPTITVGATTVTPKLHVNGDISTTGKIYTTNSVYADYVFEKYFKGSSELNPNYEFKSLNYVRDFIRANNHLPGVTSIADLSKANNGYTFDMTKLTVQSLEKIEELYLHTIEQKDKIDAQQAEIEKLKKDTEDTKARLARLEKLLFKGNR